MFLDVRPLLQDLPKILRNFIDDIMMLLCVTSIFAALQTVHSGVKIHIHVMSI